LHSFFGYADSPTALQAVVYALYLTLALLSFFGVWKRIRRHSAAVSA
jgi:high-affinity Fe2+/Pb2+ permease